MAWRSTWNSEPEPPSSGILQDRGGWLPPGVKLILFATVGVFILQMLFNRVMTDSFALSVRGLMGLQVWRLVTYMFLHANTTHILINMFIFVMLGATFERQIGARQFLAIYFASGVVGGLFEAVFNILMFLRAGGAALNVGGQTFLDIPAVGASAGVAGILVAFATLNPRAIFLVFFVLPVEARWIAIIYVIIETRHVFMSLKEGFGDNVANAAHLGGMVVGFVWMKWGSRVAEELRWQSRRAERRPFDRTRQEEQAEMDRILQKIHDQGLDSLTTRERFFLEEMTRKYQGRP